MRPALLPLTQVGQPATPIKSRHSAGPPCDTQKPVWCAQAAAAEFCARHGLPEDVIEALAVHLADHLDRAVAPTAPLSAPHAANGVASQQLGHPTCHTDRSASASEAEPEDAGGCDEASIAGKGCARASIEGGYETFEASGWDEELPAAAGEPAEARLYVAPPSDVPPGREQRQQPVDQGQPASSAATQEDGAPGPHSASQIYRHSLWLTDARGCKKFSKITSWPSSGSFCASFQKHARFGDLPWKNSCCEDL